jgi:hypothetical protein
MVSLPNEDAHIAEVKRILEEERGKEVSWEEAKEGYLQILGMAELALEVYVTKKRDGSLPPSSVSAQTPG